MIKSFRRIVLFTLVTVVLFSSVTGQTTEAATIRLNKKQASVLTGKSFQLKVSGNRKKVTWHSSNSSIAKVANGKVTGMKPGKATITAKVAGKTMKCNVTVKYNAKEAEKHIKVTKKNLYNGYLFRYTNQNKYPVSIVTTVRYRDAAKTILSEEKDHNYCLEAGKSAYMYFPKPVDRNNQYIKYKDYTVSMVSSSSKFEGVTKDITYWCSPQTVNMTATTYNYSGKNLTAARISYLMYDSKGNITAYIPYYPSCLQKNTHGEEIVNYPNYCSSPAKVKGYIDYAY